LIINYVNKTKKREKININNMLKRGKTAHDNKERKDN